MDNQVKFEYVSPAKFKDKAKSTSTLYFLTNGLLYKGANLISNICTVDDDFESASSLDGGKFYISLSSGRIKYIDESKNATDISQLMFEDIVLSDDNISTLIDAIAEIKSVTMPTLEVNDNKLVWTASNVGEISVFVAK